MGLCDCFGKTDATEKKTEEKTPFEKARDGELPQTTPPATVNDAKSKFKRAARIVVMMNQLQKSQSDFYLNDEVG